MVDLDAASLLAGSTCPCDRCTTFRQLIKEARDAREQFEQDSKKLANADKLAELVEALDVDDVQPRFWGDLQNAVAAYRGE